MQVHLSGYPCCSFIASETRPEFSSLNVSADCNRIWRVLYRTGALKLPLNDKIWNSINLSVGFLPRNWFSIVP